MDSQRQKSIFDKMIQSAAYLDKVARSGAGNYIITSKQVSDMLSEMMADRIESRKKKIRRILEWKL